jgi:two-component system, NarL family, response regulator NreC
VTVKVLLADDHPIVLQGLRRLLESKNGFQVVAETGDGLEVVGLTERYRPDVLIVDLMMPGLNGLEVTRQVCRKIEGIRVIVLSMHKDDDYVIQALRNGATGYVIKDTGPSELVEAIHQVMEGRRYLSPAIAERVSMQLLNHPDEPLEDPYEQLTSREREVLQLVAEGYTGKETADRLSISPRTVEQHRANIMRKLGLTNQREIVRYALRKGILAIDS